MHVVWKKIVRHLVLLLVFFLPRKRKIAIERWLRGREEFRRLQNADAVVVSFGKSGRTWLRVMISRFYQIRYGLSPRHLIGFDNLHRKNRAIPRIFFTHDNYIKDYTRNVDSKADFYDKKVILLVRDPRDVAISQFFQWKHRMRRGKKTLNQYPRHGTEVSVFDFVMNQDAGLPKIIDYLNLWEREAAKIRQLLVVRYEDMRKDPQQVLGRILDFIGTPGSDDQIREAVEFASYENMKRLEERRVFWLSGGRMVPGDRKNPDSYKVRRAKVGGYRDYFDDQQVTAIDQLVARQLGSFYGYGSNGRIGQAANA